MKKEIAILTTWKWDIYHIDWNIKDYMNMKTQAKQNWEDWFWCEKYQTYIKFASLEKETWKTQYISIEAPKDELTQAEKDKSAEILRKLAKKAEVNKEERFIKKRNEILERLRLEEVRLWIETTVDKIEWYNRLKVNLDNNK